MYKACSRCGKIHNSTYKCNKGRIYTGGKERELRALNKWHMKSKEIREASNYLCAVCKEEGLYTYNNLEVHHIIKVTEDETKLLDNYNLICLCQEHHKLADSGDIDKDYLFKLAELRENCTNTQHPHTQ